MGRRTGVEGFLRAAGRAMAAAERERKRSVRLAATQARQVERQHRMALAQQAREDGRQPRTGAACKLCFSDPNGEAAAVNLSPWRSVMVLKTVCHRPCPRRTLRRAAPSAGGALGPNFRHNRADSVMLDRSLPGFRRTALRT